MSLTFAIAMAVLVTLAVIFGQLFYGGFSLFSVGATFIIVSAACSAVDFLQRSARQKQSANEDVQSVGRE